LIIANAIASATARFPPFLRRAFALGHRLQFSELSNSTKRL
jgi:hypothetical protein